MQLSIKIDNWLKKWIVASHENELNNKNKPENSPKLSLRKSMIHAGIGMLVMYTLIVIVLFIQAMCYLNVTFNQDGTITAPGHIQVAQQKSSFK